MSSERTRTATRAATRALAASALGLLAAERAQFDNGSGTLARLLRRQTDLLDARLRHGEALTRVELARVALQLADGTLLDSHEVQFDDL